MKKNTVRHIFFALLLFIPFFTKAQTATVTQNRTVVIEQDYFIRKIKAVSADSSIVNSLVHYFQFQTDSIHKELVNMKMNLVEKEKAVRTLIYFISELGKSIQTGVLDIYAIPRSFESYKTVLTALIHHRLLATALTSLDPQRSQLLATVFSQYKEFTQLDDLAVYKRVAASPEFIFQFLEGKPGFRYADSLLIFAGANEPFEMVSYLNRNGWGVQEMIRNVKNVYLKQIAILSKDKQVSDLLPFVVQIADNKITKEEILAARANPTQYFQLLINTLQQEVEYTDGSYIFLKPLRKGIREKALLFYVNEINRLHESADAVRFASVKGLRPQDLYYIITSCGEDLYTSSYLGLYKRLMEQYKDVPADPIFDLIQYDDYRTFLRLAANYNVIGDLLHKLSLEKSADLVKRFVSNIESDENTALDRSMDIADCFTPVSTDPEMSKMMQQELQANLLRCTTSRQYLGIRLYSILSDMLGMVRENEMGRLWARLGDYEQLKRSAVENAKGQVTELVLFYGDDDGASSFNNFVRSYSDKHKWSVSTNNSWISIRSIIDTSLVIYANKPLDMEQELDLRAQDSLFAYLKEHSLEPTVLVHRGHSYHLDKTLKRITPAVKLAILGSCGGYNKTISIATINPDVQVIGSKKTGSMSINDPILESINETLVGKADLQWSQIWKQLADRFSRDDATLSQFNEYFPPANNLGLFVLKLYKYYNKTI